MASTNPVTSNSTLQNYLDLQAQQMAANQANVANGTNSALAKSTSLSTIGSNFDTFIHILTTQLQHQDPTNATDPNQFTQELVQFAGVEQQLNTNNNLQTLINLQKNASGTSAALNYMGQYVQGPSTSGELPLQDEKSEMVYTLGKPAASVTITVMDGNGQTLKTMSGAATQGTNYITWDGKDSSGNQLPDGIYKFMVTAKNVDGSSQTPTTEVIGKVTALRSNADGTTTLSLGGMALATSTVDAVYSTGNLPPSNAPTPAS